MEKENKKSLSSPRVAVGDLPIFVSVGTVSEREEIRRSRTEAFRDDRPLFDNGTKAFTLIELLVVVLIIGILAAVALPQYRVAVGKARLAKIIPSVTAGKTALEMYYLANGSYPPDSNTTDFGFDLDLPDCTLGPGRAGTTGGIICPDGSYYDLLDYGVANAAGWSKPYQVGYMVWLTHSDHPDERRCLAVSANEVAKKICKSMGGTEISGETHTYFKQTAGSPITVYKLP